MDGKLFLYSKTTPPPSACFNFDLQRFNGEHVDSPENGYTDVGTHLIKVEYNDSANTVLYFDSMRAAMNSLVGNAETTDTDSVYSKYKLATGKTSATVTLLGNITAGEGFIFGCVLNSDGNLAKKTNGADLAGETKVVLDLNKYTYTFATPLVNVEGNGVRYAKAMQIRRGNNIPDSQSSFTIKDGTMNVAAQPTGGQRFEHMITNYANFTLENVTLDGSNLKSQKTGEDGAVLCTSAGTLTLSGNTNIIAQDDTEDKKYYAVAGLLTNYNKLSTTTDNNKASCFGDYTAGFEINIQTTGKDINGNDCTIKNIGLANKIDTNSSWSGNFQTQKADINITSGSIGEITFAKVPVESGNASVTNNITFNADATATIGSFEFSEKDKVIFDRTAIDNRYVLAQVDSWNAASTATDNTEYNYIVSSSTAGRGNSVLNVKGVTDKTALAFDDTDSRNIFGIPEGATATLGDDYTSYKYAYLNYNKDKDEVTVRGASAENAIIASNKAVQAADKGILAETVKKIDARDNSVALSIIANSLNNTIYSGKGQSLTGGTGADVFIYGGGDNLIADYTTAQKDLVNLSRDFASNSEIATVTAKNNDLILNFGTGDSLTFTGGGNIDAKVPNSGITVESGKKTFVYNKNTIAEGYGLTLNAGYNGFTDPSKTSGGVVGYDVTQNITYYTIDGSAATTTSGLVLTGNSADNYFVGGNVKNTLYGGTGNDFLKGGSGNDIFRYSEGKDTIDGFTDKDLASISAAKLDAIASTEVKRNALVFTIDGENDLTFNPIGDVAVGKVLLSGENGGFLTKDGYVNKNENAKFKLFAGAKGLIDLKDDSVYNSANITSVDASAVKNTVTLVGASVNSEFTFGANKKKDLFEYSGAKVTLENYEGGTDRLNISGIGAISAFSVDAASKDVAISVGSDSANVISLKGAQGQEVLIHDENSRGKSFSKLVFHDTGVLYNKSKNPTKATLMSGAASLKADDSIKKIFAVGVGKAISIQSGENKATLDASEAGVGVSLIGGEKNNKFIGSGYADMFVYKGGKDVVEDFKGGASGADSISFNFGMDDAKITLSKKSIKFKFSSKNTLTLKNADSIGSAFNIKGTAYTYAKNAYSTDGGKNVSLTSAFSGTYKISDAGDVQAVYGNEVAKNLTFKGTEASEVFTGGNKKTTFKGGGGGTDSLVGGSGKDIFFYAKGDNGTANIADFDFSKDKIKIANGTISKISSVTGGGVQFGMTSGKKGDTSPIGWFKIENSMTYKSDGSKDKAETSFTDNPTVFIKANNTLYWFATESGTDINGNAYAIGDLITANRKVSKSDAAATGYDIIDLGYSTNLTKSGVATKAGDFTFSSDGISKKTTET